MGLIGYKGVLYGGGSDVVANPQDSATDTLTKVGIDGTVYTVEDADAVHTSDIGTANGVAELDSNGLVPSSQLPSYVDDVLEYASQSAFPATGETGKIYVATDTNLTYRWSGSAYVEISPSLALGETSSTAYRGDRGKTAYDHATESGKISQAVQSGLYKFGATAQGHIASTTPVAKSDLTALGVADQNDVDAIEEDIQGYKTVTGEYITVNDGAALPAKALFLTLSPVQDLNGYEYPWVAGAGNNKCDYDSVMSTFKVSENRFEANSLSFAALTMSLADYVGKQVTFSLNLTNISGINRFYLRAVVNGTATVAQKLEGETGYLSVTVTPQTAEDNINFSYGTTTGNAILIKWQDVQLELSGSRTTWNPYSNICPIHGTDEVGVNVCGKNLFDGEVEQGALNPSNGENTPNTQRYRSKNYIPVKPNTTYKVSVDGTATSANLLSYGMNKEFLSEVDKPYANQITTSANTYYLRFFGTDSLDSTKVQIEQGTTATAWEAYNGHSTTITLPSTVYGGSVEQGGSGTSNYGVHTVSSSDTFYRNSDYSFYINKSDTKLGGAVVCDRLKSAETQQQYDIFLHPTVHAIRINTADPYSTGDALRDFLLGAQIVYEKTTADTLSVTPFPQTLLEGINNVWSECSENNVVVGNAQQSLSYQPQNIVGQLRQEIEAKPDSFAQLSDTAFSNLANGQIPKWNSTSGKWENANESGGGLPAWTVLAGLGYNDDVELPATFSELLVVVANGDGYNDLLSSSIFIADVADFDVSAERFPVLQIPIYIQGSTMWSILEGSVSNNKRIYTLKGFQNSIAVIYYR